VASARTWPQRLRRVRRKHQAWGASPARRARRPGEGMTSPLAPPAPRHPRQPPLLLRLAVSLSESFSGRDEWPRQPVRRALPGQDKNRRARNAAFAFGHARGRSLVPQAIPGPSSWQVPTGRGRGRTIGRPGCARVRCPRHAYTSDPRMVDGLADGLAARLGANIQSDQCVELEIWRKGGDSNPRCP
jgi:hypothetical protein